MVLDATIRTIVIDAGHNHNLRYEVFERLNRGSMQLNEQELRNCVYRGPFCDLLAELETDPTWRKVKGGDPLLLDQPERLQGLGMDAEKDVRPNPAGHRDRERVLVGRDPGPARQPHEHDEPDPVRLRVRVRVLDSRRDLDRRGRAASVSRH